MKSINVKQASEMVNPNTRQTNLFMTTSTNEKILDQALNDTLRHGDSFGSGDNNPSNCELDSPEAFSGKLR